MILYKCDSVLLAHTDKAALHRHKNYITELKYTIVLVCYLYELRIPLAVKTGASWIRFTISLLFGKLKHSLQTDQ
jgi:hypothetical protein